jgi:hypothetical protein
MAVERRTQTFKSVLHGARYPRRRANRRPEDDQFFVPDVHDASLFFMAIAIILMSSMDAAFTLKLLSVGGEELNLAMKILLDTDTFSFLIVKYCVTALGATFLVACARIRLGGLIPVRRILETICCIYACLMIYEVYLLVAYVTDTNL